MPAKFSIDAKAKTFTVTLDLQEPTPSESGKTLLIGTTHGTVDTGLTFSGKPVKCNISAYIKPDKG